MGFYSRLNFINLMVFENFLRRCRTQFEAWHFENKFKPFSKLSPIFPRSIFIKKKKTFSVDMTLHFRKKTPSFQSWLNFYIAKKNEKTSKFNKNKK